MSDFKTHYLRDYTPPAFHVLSIHLEFDIFEDHTIVTNKMLCERDANATPGCDLVLDGEELELQRIALNEVALTEEAYRVTGESLTVINPPAAFSLTIKTKILPHLNTQLSGLYKSKKLFCTQCEAQGFRRITYYLDRPDVLTKFTTQITADAGLYPILLSNGNPIQRGTSHDERHWVIWEDPFKKPCYLFALVAGDLSCVEDTFITQSNREITLQIFVEPGNEDKCEHAMKSLKQAMLWDEQVYGREYDLDIFMIVAVSDFNMGAMENKGLNIFNSQYILANPQTATDQDYLNIQSVVAHEYFHNWTGNRITCRDWFQLSLKEGLTVFRDQEFSRDMNSRDVLRIKDVQMLRSAQFPEDAGPLAHPVRPESYVEINNFYTMTVYEKGAELIRMIHALNGPELFRKGMDEYFALFDGQAVTTDDFVHAHEIASERDLTHFKLWYQQAGTPTLTVSDEYHEADSTLTITIQQTTLPTPNQPTKQPLHMPIRFALLNSHGEITSHGEQLFELQEETQSITIAHVYEKPVVSFLRDFSAPVKLNYPRDAETLQFLLAYDNNGFTRFEAGQQLLIETIFRIQNAILNQQSAAVEPALLDAFGAIIDDANGDILLKARLFELPGWNYLTECCEIIEVDSLLEAKKRVETAIACHLQEQFYQQYIFYAGKKLSGTDSVSMNARAWKNTCLHYLRLIPEGKFIQLCVKQFMNNDIMTDRYAALTELLECPEDVRKPAMDAFYQQFFEDDLVMNKWLSLNARIDSDKIIEELNALMTQSVFDIKNPNKVRALVGGFASFNHKRFHDRSGRGYQFVANMILQLDPLNPQIAARLCNVFSRWRKFDEQRRVLMHEQLVRIQRAESLSKDVYEMVSKISA